MQASGKAFTQEWFRSCQMILLQEYYGFHEKLRASRIGENKFLHKTGKKIVSSDIALKTTDK